MDKAVEYLRGEIAKKGQRDAQAPAPNVNPAAQFAPQPHTPIRPGALAEVADRSYRNIAR